jgi:type IV secretion system protein VirB6
MGIYTQLADTFASVSQEFVNERSAAFAVEIYPYVKIILVLWISLMGIQSMFGKLQEPFANFIWRALCVVFLAALAFEPAVYQVQILDAFDQFQNAMLHAATGENTTPFAVADDMLNKGIDLGSRFFEKVDYAPLTWLHYGAPGLIVFGGSIAMTFTSAGAIILAKLGLALTLAIGPIAIAALMFPGTRKVFDSFMEDVFSSIFSIVFIAAVMGITMQIFGAVLQSYSDESSVLYYAIQLLIVILACISGVQIAQSKAAKLFGGVTSGLPNPITAAAKIATAPASAAARYMAGKTTRTSAKTGQQETASRLSHLMRGNTIANPAYRQQVRENMRSGWGAASGGSAREGGASAGPRSGMTAGEKVRAAAARYQERNQKR